MMMASLLTAYPPYLLFILQRSPNNNNQTEHLEAAKRCAEVKWKRGILQNGYGLSEGTAGNTHAFLAMYKLTKKNLYLHRAIKVWMLYINKVFFFMITDFIP